MTGVQVAVTISYVLEKILQSVRRQQERASIEKSVSDYYSSLSESEANELAQWGELALREFPDED
jgi:hypothetical protein